MTMNNTHRASAIALLVGANATQAFDVNDQFSIGGLIAAGGQCQNVSALLPSANYGLVESTDPLQYNSDLDKFDNQCRGGLPVQIEFDYQPTDRDQFFIALGWAVDNGLNETSPWKLAPWAADLEDDVKDINGSSRNYLLQAWYRHRFDLQNGSSIAGTFGILDSTSYLDANEYANDEYTQFMNEAFVNSGNYNLPSYDAGIALEAEFGGSCSANAVGMNINENDDGNNYNFWGVQLGWHPTFAIGAGNYRANMVGTSSEFAAPSSFEEPDSDPNAEQDLYDIDGQIGAGARRKRSAARLGTLLRPGNRRILRPVPALRLAEYRRRGRLPGPLLRRRQYHRQRLAATRRQHRHRLCLSGRRQHRRQSQQCLRSLLPSTAERLFRDHRGCAVHGRQPGASRPAAGKPGGLDFRITRRGRVLSASSDV